MITPEDGDKRFRFKPGDSAMVRGWDERPPVRVTAPLLHLSQRGAHCPHYIVVDEKGHEWMISQLELSSLRSKTH